MTIKERHQVRVFVSHDERGFGVAQTHAKELGFTLYAVDDDPARVPIHLPLFAGIKTQWQKHFPLDRFTLLHVPPHGA